MTEEIKVVVPVASQEPIEVVNNSIRKVTDLEVPEGASFEFFYVMDVEELDKDRLNGLKTNDSRITLIEREPDDGKKAGAMNAALDTMDEPDYVALFDVDSRPDTDYIEECLKQLKQYDDVFMVSGLREIINAEHNIITKTIETEFKLFEDFQTILDYSDAFNHFNGPMAVIDGDFAVEKRFNEDVICEDTDFTERGYLEGLRATLTRETALGEQSVTSLSDLFSQKVRWMAGAREGLENFFVPMMKSDNPAKVKMSWFMSMFLPFFAFLFSPLAIFYGVRVLVRDRKPLGAMERTFGLFLYSWFITFCGLVVLKKKILGEKIGWRSLERENL